MKKIFLLLVWVPLFLDLSGQNIVMNPGFEDYDSCPGITTDLLRVPYWSDVWLFSYSYYLNRCATDNRYSVPNNLFGTQEERQLQDGYAGFNSFLNHNNTRTIIQGQTSTPILANTKYYVTMWVNALDNSSVICTNLGMTFHADQNETSIIGIVPPLEFHGMGQVDTLTWQMVTGTFEINFNANFFRVTNFLPDSLSDTIYLNSPYPNLHATTWLAIDDVCISQNPADCGYVVGTKEPTTAPPRPRCEFEYYDLYGRKQPGPVPGLNLRKCGEIWDKVWIN